MQAVIIIPTLNAAKDLQQSIPLLVASQSPDHILIIDSGSTDETVAIARHYGIQTYSIQRQDFNHGGTRNLGRKLSNAEFLVYLTQDAIPARPDFLRNLLVPFKDSQIAISYGRQLPRPQATPLEAFPRLFNFPAQSFVKSKADIPTLGIKTFYCSNSCCAYRSSIWDELGGFPQQTLTWEDQHLSARMIAKGYKIAYAADATVFHSHAFTLSQEFQRYFDAGAFLKKEAWIGKMSGKAEGEGTRFLREELNYLLQQGQQRLIPYALLSTAVKYLGFRVGMLEPHLPLSLKRAFSQQHYFWR